MANSLEVDTIKVVLGSQIGNGLNEGSTAVFCGHVRRVVLRSSPSANRKECLDVL